MGALDLTELRIDLAARVKWNIGFWVAGCIFWLYAAGIGASFPLERARWFWFVGSFAIVPLAHLASFILGADPSPKGNKLAELVGITHASVILLTFPLVIATMLFYPAAQISVMAICFGLDFYVMTWAYGTRIPAIHGFVRVATVTIIWFALPGWRIVGIPLFVAATYFISILLMYGERKKWLEAHQGMNTLTPQ